MLNQLSATDLNYLDRETAQILNGAADRLASALPDIDARVVMVVLAGLIAAKTGAAVDATLDNVTTPGVELIVDAARRLRDAYSFAH